MQTLPTINQDEELTDIMFTDSMGDSIEFVAFADSIVVEGTSRDDEATAVQLSLDACRVLRDYLVKTVREMEERQ